MNAEHPSTPSPERDRANEIYVSVRIEALRTTVAEVQGPALPEDIAARSHILEVLQRNGYDVLSTGEGKYADAWVKRSNASAASDLKFCILAHGEVARENVLYVFDTAEERDVKTLKLIFGHGEPETQAEADEWDAHRNELNDSGEIRFEGDPGIDWFVALLP